MSACALVHSIALEHPNRISASDRHSVIAVEIVESPEQFNQALKMTQQQQQLPCDHMSHCTQQWTIRRIRVPQTPWEDRHSRVCSGAPVYV